MKSAKSEIHKYSRNSNISDVNKSGNNLLESSDMCGPNLYYSIIDGTLSITGSGYMSNYSKIETNLAPWSAQSDNIIKIIIGSDVCSTGSYAFYNLKNVTSIIFSDSITLIGSHSLDGCKSELPKNIKTIEDGAFKKTGIFTFTIPENIQYISKDLFVMCQNLHTVNFIGNNKIIGDYAFYLCENLKSIELPEDIVNIGEYAFLETGLISIEIPKNVVDLKKGVLSECHSLKNVIFLGNNVKNIYEYSFEYSENLQYIELPKSLENIYNYSFQHTGLISITIPEKVTTINFLFESCQSLTTVSFLFMERLINLEKVLLQIC